MKKFINRALVAEKKLFILLAAVMLVLTSCEEKTTPTVGNEDLSKFNTQSIIGIWVRVHDDNTVYAYYDIKSDSHVLYVERPDDEPTQKAVYDPSDGYLHTTDNVEWKTYGDFVYSFNVSKQIIRCTSGSWLGFKVNDVKAVFGQDEVFSVSRMGLDEAYLTSLVNDKVLYGFIHFTVYDGHVYRIKGIKQDLN